MKNVLAWLVIAAFVILPWLTGMGNTVVHAGAGDSRKGKTVYEKSCVLCHGPQGRGDGPVGKTINPPAADFTSAASKKQTDAELLATIENGLPTNGDGGLEGATVGSRDSRCPGLREEFETVMHGKTEA